MLLTFWRPVQVTETTSKLKRAQESANMFSALSDAFGKKGIQHFQLDSAVRDLGSFAAHFLEHLSSSFQLSLEMQQVCLAVLALRGEARTDAGSALSVRHAMPCRRCGA
jgi:hypothetical protein